MSQWEGEKCYCSTAPPVVDRGSGSADKRTERRRAEQLAARPQCALLGLSGRTCSGCGRALQADGAAQRRPTS